jgi:esterase
LSLPLTLAVNELGAGPPVVLLHGLLGRGRNWQSVARALEDRYTVQLVDLRNHGASPWSEEMGYRAMAADVAAMIEGLGAGPIGLIGHSMGGKVAMTLALTRPELVTRLVVVDIAPVTYRQGYETYIDAMLAVDLAANPRRAEVEAALAAAVPEPAMRAFLVQNLVTRDGRAGWQPNLAVLRRTMPELSGFSVVPDKAGFDGPAWCLRGARSAYVDAAGEAALRRLFPRLQIANVAGAGHWPHAEQPAAFLEALTSALAA